MIAGLVVSLGFLVLWIQFSPGASLQGSLAMLVPLVVLPVVSILTGGEEDVSLRIREKRAVGNTEEIEEPRLAPDEVLVRRQGSGSLRD